MKKFRAFLFRSRLTYWLTFASINLVVLTSIHLLFRTKGDWFFTVGLALWMPTFFLLIKGRNWR